MSSLTALGDRRPENKARPELQRWRMAFSTPNQTHLLRMLNERIGSGTYLKARKGFGMHDATNSGPCLVELRLKAK